MSEEPEIQLTSDAIAKNWLYRFEGRIRKADFVAAYKMLHSRCGYFGVEKDSPAADWKAIWPDQPTFSFDMSKTKLIPENNMILISTVWVADESSSGRGTIVLLRFKDEKILAVHAHFSRLTI